LKTDVHFLVINFSILVVTVSWLIYSRDLKPSGILQCLLGAVSCWGRRQKLQRWYRSWRHSSTKRLHWFLSCLTNCSATNQNSINSSPNLPGSVYL